MPEILPIPTIVLLVESMKLVGLPDKYVKPLVLLLALLFGFVYYWNTDIAIKVGAVVGYAVGSMGSYSLFLKPTKDLIEKV